VIDSHCHLHTARFDSDRADVIQRAWDSGIEQMMVVGCSLEDSRAAVDLAIRHDRIHATVGIHPHDADTAEPGVLDQLEALAADPHVVAYGEIGLDFYYDNSPRDVQVDAFRRQLTLANRLDLPVVIHTRDAEPETLAVLGEIPAKRGGQVHCYTGSMGTAKRLLELGFHIGFTGIISFKNAGELREVVAMVPMERLLIETDSPYLAPLPHRGKRNEPAFVRHVAEVVAGIKGLEIEAVIAITSRNFRELFPTRSQREHA